MSESDELLRRLGSEDRTTQRRACDEASARLRADSGFRDHIIRLLRDGSPLARFSAAFLLFQEGPTLRILPALLEALELDDGDLRWTAAHMLATLGRSQAEVLPVVSHEARNASSAQRRRMALYVIRELAPELQESERILIEAVDDPDADVRRAALSSFAKLADPGPGSVERMLTALGVDPDPRMRRIAAVVAPELATRLPRSRAAIVPALEAASHSADPDLARAATLALRRLAPS